MAAIDRDTKLVMTIMYVGAMAGMNVYFYSVYGTDLPFSALTHAVLFSLITIGIIMMQKSLFDMVVNERLEMWLLNRRIDMYWEKRKRDESQRAKIRESMKSNMSPYTNNFIQPASGYGEEVNEGFLKP